MTWTYDSTSIGTDLAKIRLLCGDTDTNDQQLTDEEINFFDGQTGNVYAAAAMACEALATKYARQADKKVGELSISLSQKAQAYRDLAADLRKRGGSFALPLVGGISEAGKSSIRDDTDRVEPFFERDQFTHPGTIRSTELTNEDS